MGSVWRRLFKEAAAEAAQACGVSLALFLREWSLGDFLIDAFPERDSPQEVAARALEYLCEKGHRARNRLACSTVLRFLNKTVGAPTEGPSEQCFRDLKEVLDGPCDYQAFLDWMKSWYP